MDDARYGRDILLMLAGFLIAGKAALEKISIGEWREFFDLISIFANAREKSLKAPLSFFFDGSTKLRSSAISN